MDPVELLRGWRQRGEQRVDPVHFRFIEAMAERASTRHGLARSILDEKLATLVAAYGERITASPRGAAAGQEQDREPGPLAELVQRLEDRPGAAQPSAGVPELKSMRYFKSTWSRLRADRVLTQSLAKLPENAGPLNSQHLVHRSLKLMRELSPDYLQQFMAYVDVLARLER